MDKRAILKLQLKFEGLNVDAVYENYVRQIAGEKINVRTGGESLKESVTRDEHKQISQKQIAILQVKIRKEKRLNKQMQMNSELKKLRKESEEL